MNPDRNDFRKFARMLYNLYSNRIPYEDGRCQEADSTSFTTRDPPVRGYIFTGNSTITGIDELERGTQKAGLVWLATENYNISGRKLRNQTGEILARNGLELRRFTVLIELPFRKQYLSR